jgi:hypothetical protein
VGRELDGSVGDDPGHGGGVAAPQPEEAVVLQCPVTNVRILQIHVSKRLHPNIFVFDTKYSYLCIQNDPFKRIANILSKVVKIANNKDSEH